MRTKAFRTGKTSRGARDRRRRALQVAAVAVACALSGTRGLDGKETAPGEYEVKAAFLYNFGKFVQWPARAGLSGPFQLCVLGDDPFGPLLYRTIAGETIDGRRVVARQIFSAEEAGGCRVLFISSSKQAQLMDVLAALAGTSALTVSDMPEFVQRGGMIQFVLMGKRVRFAINLSAAERVGLRLSSQLLKLAISEQEVAGSEG